MTFEREMGDTFSGFYDTHRARLVASLAVAVGNDDVAQDCADEAFARALARWDRVERMGSPQGWTYRVAFNLARRAARKRRREQELWSRVPPSPVPPEDQWQVMAAVLAALPERQRLAVGLRVVADLTEVEIARIMGVRRSTVSAALSSARPRITAILSEVEPDDHRSRVKPDESFHVEEVS